MDVVFEDGGDRSIGGLEALEQSIISGPCSANSGQ